MRDYLINAAVTVAACIALAAFVTALLTESGVIVP